MSESLTKLRKYINFSPQNKKTLCIRKNKFSINIWIYLIIPCGEIQFGDPIIKFLKHI